MIYDIQKASMWRRLSSFLLDIILIAVLATGFALFVAWVTNYDKYQEKLSDYYLQYEEEYGLKVSMKKTDYDELSEEDQNRYLQMVEDMNNNQDLLYCYNMTINLMLVIISGGVFLSVLILEFFVPLIFKNGQTIGKKVFSTGVIKINGVKTSKIQLFVRAILGKYAIEIMLPILLIILLLAGTIGYIGMILLVGLVIFQLMLVSMSKNHQAIHDVLAYTVVVDLQTQMIFDNEDELLEYKKQNHLIEIKSTKD